MYELEPAALRPGSTIKFIAPSSLLRDVEISTGIRFLQKQGFKVVFSLSITYAPPTRFFTTGGYLRKQELENAFKSDDVDAIIAIITVPIGVQAELDAESSVKMLEKAVD